MLYPITNSKRVVIDLSGIWDFVTDDGTGFAEKIYAKPLKNAITMPVPSSYNDLKESAALRDFCGWVFYQKTIAIPDFMEVGNRVVLRCDAVTHHAKVYWNGELIAEHKGGFLPFEVNLTGKIQPGDNLLTIAVGNQIDHSTLPVGRDNDITGMVYHDNKPRNFPNFDYFNYAGITRPIRICTTPDEDWIDDISLSNSILEQGASLHYKVNVMSHGNISHCHVVVSDPSGTIVASSDGAEGDLSIPRVQLWWPGNPFLYNVTVTTSRDEYTLPYGVRSVEVRGTKFLINGKPFYFKGYGKHEDTFPNGRGFNLVMEAKDISLMKWQHANSFRTSHYPYCEEMMRLCDREGIVVIDETPAVGINLDFSLFRHDGAGEGKTYDPVDGVKTFEHHKDVIRDMIDRDKNYACVVMWSIANEANTHTKGAYEYFAPLVQLTKEYDPQKRPCTLVGVNSSTAPENDVISALSDVICLNRYYGWYDGGPDLEYSEQALRSELTLWKAIGKPLIITEYGADTVMGLHDTVPVMFTEEYQLAYYEMNNRVLDSFNFVVGEQAWNFADFATGQGTNRVQGNKKGLFTRDRRPKLAAHYFRKRWAEIADFKEDEI
jgi:beta-glucuronidase